MTTKLAFHWAVWLVLLAAGGLILLLVLFLPNDLRVVDVHPEGRDQAASITAPIRITCSAPIDPVDLQARLSIEPHVQGIWETSDKEAWFRPTAAFAPGTTYTVTLKAGLRDKEGRSLPEDYVWSFYTRVPELLTLRRPEQGADLRQLYLSAMDGKGPRALTDHPLGVWDYDVHPQGDGIVYSVLRKDGGADLWRMDRDGANRRRLLACPEAACVNPAWSPDGAQLAYERRGIWAEAPNLDPQAGRIWILDLEQGKERPLFDYDVPLHSPVWSPQGGRLAYVSPVLPGVEVYDLVSGDLQQFTNEWGAVPAWAPDGGHLVVPELMLAGEDFVVRLVRLDLETGEAADISGDPDFVKDVAPAWSPGGGWIVFGRQFLNSELWTPGRQVWLTRPDSSEAYALSEEPMADRYAFAWRPDGGALAYARADVAGGAQPIPDVAVWVFDFAKGKALRIAEDAVLPKWLP